MINELLERLKQCDDYHNRCDYLMEHDEITYMLDYITNLQKENEALKKINEQLCKELNTSNMSEEEWLDYAINYNLEELEKRCLDE